MSTPQKSTVETEIKLPFSSPSAAQQALATAGFTLHTPRGLEVNTLYDTPDGSLRQQGIVIRHRTWHGQHIITYKGPAALLAGEAPESFHKQREELETTATDAAPILATWQAAGLRPTFRYEKYRSTYTQKDAPGEAMLDETPLGTYVELEGPGSWIDRTASLMGFVGSDYIQKSYAALHADECRRKGITFGDLMFTAEQ